MVERRVTAGNFLAFMTGAREMTGPPVSQGWTTRLIRWSLALVFLWAGASKMAQPPSIFADSVASFHALPSSWIAPFTLSLPAFELLVGGALVTTCPRRLGAGGALLLGILFALALAWAIARGIKVDCGCFGHGGGWLSLKPGVRMWFDLTRDGLIVLAAWHLYRRELVATQREV